MPQAHPVHGARTVVLHALLIVLAAPAGATAASDPELRALQHRLEALAEQNEQLQSTVESLRGEVQEARDEARAALDHSTDVAAGAADRHAEAGAGPIFSRSAGPARLQLLDISLNLLAAAGWSSAADDVLLDLQGGGHDPRQRGFTLQNAELSFAAAVDPFFDAEAHLIYFIDGAGESRFELEEAFATTRMLPFGLEGQGLQLEVGQFFTEFGRRNPQHPHQWQWQDQPLILSRLLGEDGMRGPGARLGWLLPLPWTSELHLGLQNPKGETMVSFLAAEEVFADRPLGGAPFADVAVGSPGDLVKLVRWVNGFDLSDTVSAQLGSSFLHGPNATGKDADTTIAGADFVAKWRPLATDRGWPFLTLEAELLRRRYEVDANPGQGTQADVLRDWGGYVQLLYGFVRNWAFGIRYEYASGSGDGLDPDAGFAVVSRTTDPHRSDRQRLSPLLLWQASEFSRVRLQYNLDDVEREAFGDDWQHSVWLGFDFAIGAHTAHAY